MAVKRALPRNIGDVLRKRGKHGTVLGVALPIFSAHIEAARAGKEFEGLTKDEIRRGFEALGGVVHSEYHPTYLDRSVGSGGFLERTGEAYRFRADLVLGISAEQLQELYDELMAALRAAREQRLAVISKLRQTSELPDDQIEERCALIRRYLSEITGNHGEMFEVVSFAVLREYFRAFGFSLHRFSTTQANDGGMDFVAAEAIYQVSTDRGAEKLRRDLAKAPGTRRVVVRPELTTEVASAMGESVLETIELADLLEHFVGWLLARDRRQKKAAHLQKVLETALSEFRREQQAES